MSYVDISDLIGKTLISCGQIDGNDGEEILFDTDDGYRYRMYHSQNCCESVWIESVVGSFSDLIGSPITMAEEACYDDPNPDGFQNDREEWTFYKLATVKGYVDIRWFGSSNGYYSIGVDITRTKL